MNAPVMHQTAHVVTQVPLAQSLALWGVWQLMFFLKAHHLGGVYNLRKLAFAEHKIVKDLFSFLFM
jgi:hypothetical protein